MSEQKRPQVGVGVMIFKDGKILLSRRKNAHGAGEYAFPGGHLEFGESFADCAQRETREEAGIEIENIRFQFVSNLRHYSGKHYAHIGLAADWKSGVPVVKEPDKAEDWQWFGIDEVPSPLFEACRLAVEAHRSRQNYFDD